MSNDSNVEAVVERSLGDVGELLLGGVAPGVDELGGDVLGGVLLGGVLIGGVAPGGVLLGGTCAKAPAEATNADKIKIDFFMDLPS